MADEVVYSDNARPSSWLHQHDWPVKIVKSLQASGYKTVDVAQLIKWVKEKVNKKTAYESCLVFSQDIVPEEVMQSSPNGLFRRYLDAGGRIVWIGDTPLWTQAILPHRKVMEANGQMSERDKDREEVWMGGLHYAVLKVQPLIADSSSSLAWHPRLTSTMRSKWLSLRPIALEVGDDWSSYGLDDLVVTPLARTSVTLIPSSWNALVVARWKKSGRRIRGLGGSFGFPATSIGAQVEFSESFPRELSLHPLTLACAWHISFNSQFPCQGFYRLWDCGSEADDPPEALLSDMLLLARSTLRIP